jgi:holo-[acyl-carrier protein] synthase
MIHGIGTDIVAVKRMHAMWERHGNKTLEKLLAPEEIGEFTGTADKGRFLAKRFAAKEALGKALGTGIRPPAVLPSIAVAHDELGKPMLVFHGRLAEMIQNQRLTAHLSLSDEAEYAIAFVILERS